MLKAETKLSSDPAESKDAPEPELFPPLSLPFKHSVIDGWVYPPFIQQEAIERTRKFQLREDDVFIATYPKCGTTWTQNIISKLHEVHQTGALEGLGSHLLEVIPWLENSCHEQIAERPSPRYLKTHNPYEHLAKNPVIRCKYIVVSRNPKDACVSLYHHAKGFAVFNYSGDFASFAELFLEGKVESGCWWTHLKQYKQNKEDLDILLLRYEDLHSEGLNMIRQINDFLELPELTESNCKRVLEETSFDKMKKDPSANYSWRNEGRKKDESPFMRKGKVGDWTNFFNKDLSDRFDKKTKEMLGELEVFNDYITGFPEQ